MSIKPLNDRIVFSPGDIREDFRPVGKDTGKETFIQGTYNPGMTRLKNGHILLMVRVAEHLRQVTEQNRVLSPRWDVKKKKYVIDYYPKKIARFMDPRQIDLMQPNRTIAMRLTGISWLLPVEMNPGGMEIVKIHYSKALFSQIAYQEYGVEDPRITKIANKYYMTVVGVGSNKIGTSLYESSNGIHYKLKRLMFDHQNRDVVLFPNKFNKRYVVLTRPEGKANVSYPPKSKSIAGRYINAAFSPDLIHWAPHETIVLTLKENSLMDERIGAGAPPISIIIKGNKYFLALFHAVQHEEGNPVGIYRIFPALFDKKNPAKIVKVGHRPLLEFNPKLRTQIKGKLFLKRDVVFTTGILPYEDKYLVCSGELDTAIRMTVFSKKQLHAYLNPINIL